MGFRNPREINVTPLIITLLRPRRRVHTVRHKNRGPWFVLPHGRPGAGPRVEGESYDDARPELKRGWYIQTAKCPLPLPRTPNQPILTSAGPRPPTRVE